jgi:hypothetical protein
MLFLLRITWNIKHNVPLDKQNMCSLPDFEALQLGFKKYSSKLGRFS